MTRAPVPYVRVAEVVDELGLVLEWQAARSLAADDADGRARVLRRALEAVRLVCAAESEGRGARPVTIYLP